MARNEAKVKFSAETAEFTSGIKQMNTTLTGLRGALKLNAAELKANGSSVDLLQQRQALLQQELAAVQSKVELTSGKLDKAKEIFGENSAEAQKWATELAKAQAQELSLSGQLDAVTGELADQQSAMGQLTAQIDSQEAELAALKKEYVNACLTFGENSDEAGELAGRITELSGELNDNKTALHNAEQAADQLTGAVDDTADAAQEAADGGINSLDVAIGNLAADAVEKGVSAMADLGKAAVAAAQELDEGYDIIITKTGATGEALEELNSVANQIYGSMPVEMSDIGTAVGEVNTRFGSTGDELDSLSRKFLQFAEINGTDVNNSIDTVDKIMMQWGIDAQDTSGLLGVLTKAGQDTGISVDALMSSVSDNSAAFKQLGFSAEESIQLLAQMEANGVDTSTAVAGLKKSVIALTDSGMAEDEALRTVIGSIKNAKTDTEALTIAQKTFGSKGAAEMATAIREGRIDLDDLSVSMSEYGTVVEDTFNATLDPWDDASVAVNNLKIAGAELATNALTIVQPALDGLVTAAQGLVDITSNASTLIQEHETGLTLLAVGIGTVTTALGLYRGAQALANAGALAAGTIKAGETAAITASSVALGIETAATTAATAATSAFGAVMAFVTSPITLVVLAIGALVAAGVLLYKNWDTVKAKASTAWSGIKSIIGNGVEFVSGKWTALKTTAINTFNGVKDAILDPIGTATSFVKEQVGKIKGFFSGLKISLPKIKLPHFTLEGEFDPLKLKVPKMGVKWYATGGVTQMPTIAGIGEAGREALLPLDRNTSWADTVAGLLETRLAAVTPELDYDRLERIARRLVDGISQPIIFNNREVGRMVREVR